MGFFQKINVYIIIDIKVVIVIGKTSVNACLLYTSSAYPCNNSYSVFSHNGDNGFLHALLLVSSLIYEIKLHNI